MLPNYNIGWTGSLAWNGLTLSYGFTGRFGGLVVSDTQAVLDKYGVSKVTADARDAGGVQVGIAKSMLVIIMKRFFQPSELIIHTMLPTFVYQNLALVINSLKSGSIMFWI